MINQEISIHYFKIPAVMRAAIRVNYINLVLLADYNNCSRLKGCGKYGTIDLRFCL